MTTFTHFSRLEGTVATFSALLSVCICVNVCVCVCVRVYESVLVCNCQDGDLMTLWMCSQGVTNEAYVYEVQASVF